MKGERPARRRFYLDTSAYLCMLLGEEEAERLEKETSGGELLASGLLILEAKRNLVRLAREGVMKAGQYKICSDRLGEDCSLFIFRDLTIDICRSNVLPAVATPRSLDLAHLRTALAFHAEEKIFRFLTLDRAQKNAAQELGLPV